MVGGGVDQERIAGVDQGARDHVEGLLAPRGHHDVVGGGGHALALEVAGDERPQPGQPRPLGVAEDAGAEGAKDVIDAAADQLVRD